MIDHFTLESFESSLPRHKATGEPLCKPLGLLQGEYSYMLPISDHAGILIRSSIDRSGHSADTGEDSIRAYIVSPASLKPIGSKVGKYTTRVPGWASRLSDALRKLYLMGVKVRPCSCGKTLKIFKCKQGANAGKLFLKCECGRFEWIEK